jgi:fermentation-respiration switch protein FrsA (DUF1100 family)
VQRLCELLLFPRDYYSNVDKLVHAVEKLLTVTGWAPSLVPPPEEVGTEGECSPVIKRISNLVS